MVGPGTHFLKNYESQSRINAVLSILPDNPGDSRFWTASPGLQIRVWNLLDNRRKFAISFWLDSLTMKFQIFCVVWTIDTMLFELLNCERLVISKVGWVLMLTLNVSSHTPVCNVNTSNKMWLVKLCCNANNICFERFESLQKIIFKTIGMNECFLHKLRHVPCIVTSSIIPSLSTLNICKCWGLTALRCITVQKTMSPYSYIKRCHNPRETRLSHLICRTLSIESIYLCNTL